ncbi:hypothetical protein DACRYDRAFT_103633 [Dacryopinax primogenitus]|uniref:Uncharacterized protein n=1 Tax=Dacryopinax primogenitus (strain DJM 731) TaxID=1858805 RepID=M5GDB4_DACPD|nr:uncharacterized protein DACRYDRAFT_103633 [Dacryopinax primogenitus]EJU06685.1 hypothetical protein DACRYDRAFT_103633 [Dacryopinax primogenitus]
MFHPYYRRGPSRLLWFLIGGGVFAWWYHHRDRKEAIMQGRTPEQWGWHGCHKWGRERWLENGPQQRQNGVPATGTSAAPAVAVDANNKPAATTTPQQGDPWEAEREKMRRVGQQSVEAASDIAELSLDGVLSAVEGLRSKLAEFRQQREQHRARSQSDPLKPTEPEYKV